MEPVLHGEGIKEVFHRQSCWYAIPKGPVSAITHFAEVQSIEEYGDSGKYKLTFKSPAVLIDRPIPLGSSPSGALQGPRYTMKEKLHSAKSLADLV